MEELKRKRKPLQQQQTQHQEKRHHAKPKLQTNLLIPANKGINLFDLPDEILSNIFESIDPTSMRDLSRTGKIARELNPKCNLFDYVKAPIRGYISMDVEFNRFNIINITEIRSDYLDSIKLKDIPKTTPLCFKIKYYFDFHTISLINVNRSLENIIHDGKLSDNFLKNEVIFQFNSKCFDTELQTALNEITILLNAVPYRCQIEKDMMFKEWKNLKIENPTRLSMASDNITITKPTDGKYTTGKGFLRYDVLFLPVFSHEQIIDKLSYMNPLKYKKLIEQTKTGTKNLYGKTTLDIKLELHEFLINAFTEDEIFNAPKICILYTHKVNYDNLNIKNILEYWMRDSYRSTHYLRLFNIC